MEKRYSVFEEQGGRRETVLKTDCLEEAREYYYKKCYGSGRGAGGVWDNTTPKGGYGWVC